jgi:hypothetical protein
MLDRLVVQIGFGWAMRTCAFLILALLVFSNLTVRSRILPMPTKFTAISLVKPLTELPFLLTTVASLIFYLGLFLPINYIQFQAESYGMHPSLANYLIPILNAARFASQYHVPILWLNYRSLFGRILPGYVADKVGRYNTITVMSFFSAILVLALWLPAKANAPLIVFAALYGFSSGAFVSLLPALVAQISDMREIGSRTGLLFAVLSVPALVSNPIGGAFIAYDNRSFRDLQIWTGVILLSAGFLYIGARTSQVGLKFIVEV